MKKKTSVLLLFILQTGFIFSQSPVKPVPDAFTTLLAQLDEIQKVHTKAQKILKAKPGMKVEQRKTNLLPARQEAAKYLFLADSCMKLIDQDNVDMLAYARFTHNQMSAYFDYFDIAFGFRKDGTDDINDQISGIKAMTPLLPISCTDQEKTYRVDEAELNRVIGVLDKLKKEILTD
jgi:hypothetical protein